MNVKTTVGVGGAFLLCIAVATGCQTVGPATAAKQEPATNAIVLTASDGKAVSVPLTGKLANPQLIGVARNIQSFQEALAARPAVPLTVRPEVEAAIRQVAIEQRDDAVESLRLAIAVGARTSAGQPDATLMKEGNDQIAKAQGILSISPPPQLIVATHISIGDPDAVLKYMLIRKYREKSTDWTSYSDGATLPIGRYTFRAVGGTLKQAYIENVLVYAQPTNFILKPDPETHE